jgi:DNA recombination protein RmuC
VEAVLLILLVAVLAAVLFLLWYLNGAFREMTRVQLELRGMTGEIKALEQGQTGVGESLRYLQSEISQARLGLTALQSQAQARAAGDQQIAESVRRLETVIAGTRSKGAAGENILDVMFSQLPIEWQVRDFVVGNKPVEFALRLPNNRILPIDSKWPATDLIERFHACDDPVERQRLQDQIRITVIAKAREVRKYLDPNLTLSFGIAVVPDAVYDLSTDVHVHCFEQNVVLVAYSMFLPYLLLVFQTVLRTSQDIDLEKLDAHLTVAEANVRALEEELEGRFSRAITMLANSKTELSSHVSKIHSSIVNVRPSAVQESLPPEESSLPTLGEL